MRARLHTLQLSTEDSELQTVVDDIQRLIKVQVVCWRFNVRLSGCAVQKLIVQGLGTCRVLQN